MMDPIYNLQGPRVAVGTTDVIQQAVQKKITRIYSKRADPIWHLHSAY